MSDDVPLHPRRSFSRAPAALDSDLVSALQDLRIELDGRRLGIFQQHLARRIRLASPLLLDACSSEELDTAIARLRPPPRWPAVAAAQTYIRDGRRPRPRSFEQWNSEAPASPALFPFERDVILLRVSDRSAHMVLRNGATSIQTADFGGHVSLPGMLAFADRDRLVGGPLERAFPHPVARRRDYVVQSADLHLAAARTVVVFTAAPIEWRVPWSRPTSDVPF